MVMNQMFQFVKQLSGRLSPNIYTSFNNPMDASNIAFVRQLQKEMKREDVLEVPFSQLKVVVFDIETTGFNPQSGDRILSIGAVKMVGDYVLDNETYYSLIYSDQEISDNIEKLTGIQTEQLKQAPTMEIVLQEFYQFVQSHSLVAHHATHEKNFMQHATWSVLKTNFQHRVIDTSFLTKIVTPELNLVTLDECCSHYGIAIHQRHHALADALATARLWSENVRLVQKLGFANLKDVYSHLAKT